MGDSIADLVGRLTPDQADRFLTSLTPRELDVALAELAAVEMSAAPRYDDLDLLPHQQPPAGDWGTWCLFGGRGTGKALALDTPLPTPDGWTTMGKVQPGDVLFDQTGRTCNVLATYDVQTDDAWRLTFSDGSTIDACGDHLWTTWTHRDRKAYLRSQRTVDTTDFPDDWPTWRSQTRWGSPTDIGPATRTTRDIVATLTIGRRGDTNHAIPNALPLHTAERDLPIDPYTLGAWLGDGTSTAAALTIHPRDVEIVDRVRRAGHDVRRIDDSSGRTPTWPVDPSPQSGRPRDPDRQTWTPRTDGLYARLRDVGLIGNKHVPDVYLRASEQQRLDLLRGLMDTDGHASRSCVEFTSTRRQLADAVVELARTLGERPVISEGRATINGRDCGPKWRVLWQPARHVPFYLARKAAAVRVPAAQGLRRRHRMIVSADQLPSQPMRCITVDSPHRLYLAGAAMIPTHNTSGGSAEVYRHVMEDPPCIPGIPGGHHVALVAPTLGDASSAVNAAGGLKSLDPRVREVTRKGGTVVEFPNGTILGEFGSHAPADVDRLRAGARGGFCYAWAEELVAWRQVGYDGDSWDLLLTGLRLGPNPRLLVTTTPKPKPLIRELHDAATDPDNVDVVMTHGTMYDNPHLSARFVARMETRYRGTRTEAQELLGRLLGDVEGALWDEETLTLTRRRPDQVPRLDRVVVGVDPAFSEEVGSDETGIVVAGSGSVRGRRELFVLDDLSGGFGALSWPAVAVGGYRDRDAFAIVAEANLGGRDFIRRSILAEDPNVTVETVQAREGKRTRAEPVAGLYRQQRAHHVGTMPLLEAEQTSWVPGEKSPNRLDAAVWALTWLAGPLLRGDTTVQKPSDSGRRGLTSATRRTIR